MPIPEHIWEDVSHHGSPLYECAACGEMKYKCQSDYCPKAEAYHERQRVDKENKERWEYQRMKAERDRWEELHAKYGNK